jgi:hypothetical protein
MFPITPSLGWEAIERLQHFIDSRKVTPVAFGSDEALSAVLDYFPKDSVPSAEHIERRFRCLRRNRVRKQRNRVRLLFAAALHNHDGSSSNRIDDADELCDARRRMTPAEWALFQRIAAGETLGEIAQDSGLSFGQLRTRLCRLRSRVRSVA